ncbi:MAG: TIGR03915 family putative DNA repair protein [Oscillospiraceae bacterium]|nr:TIGR03915 family putative DNA repair protein [Oscillospiraceae bacterium]
MRQRTDVIFVYDGTFDGFLCCVHEYYYSSFNPVEIVCEEDVQASFFQQVTIVTDSFKADRVKGAIATKISKYSLQFLKECMLVYGQGRELHMLRYVVKGFKKGQDINKIVTDEDVDWLLKSHRHLQREKHLYLGLVRFYKAGDVYISVIKPKNKILPLIAHHFTSRFAHQSFMIYDAANRQALMYNQMQATIIQAENIELPPVCDDEMDMQRLWKLFYDTIAIKERDNPRCRMNFMPKRTWDMLPEMQDLSSGEDTGRLHSGDMKFVT